MNIVQEIEKELSRRKRLEKKNRKSCVSLEDIAVLRAKIYLLNESMERPLSKDDVNYAKELFGVKGVDLSAVAFDDNLYVIAQENQADKIRSTRKSIYKVDNVCYDNKSIKERFGAFNVKQILRNLKNAGCDVEVL